MLPANAQRPTQDSRPWPVALLTALGTWLAAVPLLFVVGSMFGEIATHGMGTYVTGGLALAGAVAMLRSSRLPLFLEQLAVPALLHEMQPYDCVRCAKPFGTLLAIENMLTRLAGQSMLQGEALERLRMCGDCRVIDIYAADNEFRITGLKS